MVMAFTRTIRTTARGGRRRLHHRIVHIWPEFFASLTGAPLPLFRSPLIEDPATAASVRRLHQALTGGASELERYQRLAVTARLLAGHASGGAAGAGGPAVAAKIRELIQDGAADLSGGDLSGGDLTADDLAAAAGEPLWA